MNTSKMLRSTVWCVVVMGAIASTVQSAEMLWQPIRATGSYVIVGNEIRLTGGGQRVFLEMRLSGWAPDTLSTWQGVLDPTPLGQICVGGGNAGNACFRDFDCFGGGTCAATRSGPIGLASEPCAANSDCIAAFADSSAVCDIPSGLCKPGWQDQSRPEFVIAGGLSLVDTSTPFLRYGSAVLTGAPAIDTGVVFYGGTLALDVPATAAGSYDIVISPTSDDTFMVSGVGAPILPITITNAVITVICQSNADCNDNDACTTDQCEVSGVCSHTANFDIVNFCCNPTNGALTALDDGNECTDNLCAGGGSVSHPPVPEFAACGNQSNSECDGPDSCDGAGTCLDRLVPSGVLCGDPTNTDCNGADTCDGTGTCQSNLATAGTACGDPLTSQCDNADTCNASGLCLPNHVANGTVCDDTLFCVVGETCSGGVCGGGTARDCSDGLTCTTDVCNETTDTCDSTLDPNNCLIAGVCVAEAEFNPANDCEWCDSLASTTAFTIRADGSTCNDGDPCTGTGRPGVGVDTCTAGTCAGVLDLECNDDCAFAIEATIGTTTSNNNNGGPDDGEASCQPDSNNDIWFFFTATCNAPVFVSTTGSALTPSNDTVLNIYDACPAAGGVEIACNDDSGVDLQSALTFTAVSGMDYLIRVAGFGANTGSVVVNISMVDDCLIGNSCYAAGELNPNNPCLICAPGVSTTDWTPRLEGSACGSANNDECDSPDACNGLGVCETNFKPDGTPCLDDGNDCSMDLCSSGVCSHPPEPVGLACGDPSVSECDLSDSCDGTGICLSNFVPSGTACGDPTETQCDAADICDGGGACIANLLPNGTPCDDNEVCTGSDACQTGLCEGTPIPQAPIVDGLGGFSIDVTPLPLGSVAPVALRVTSPDWPCVDLYIDANGSLVTMPVVQLPSAWGTINVTGLEIAPSSTYDVVAECGAFTSPVGSGTTWLFADFNNDGLVDFRDITLSVDYFLGKSNLPLVLMDIAPCGGDGLGNFRDIHMTVGAFLEEPYPCQLPCP